MVLVVILLKKKVDVVFLMIVLILHQIVRRMVSVVLARVRMNVFKMYNLNVIVILQHLKQVHLIMLLVLNLVVLHLQLYLLECIKVLILTFFKLFLSEDVLLNDFSYFWIVKRSFGLS